MASNPLIPMAHDVASVVGDAAQGVANHGLLLQKFAAPKTFHGEKQDNANRWSMLRIAQHGPEMIRAELEQAKKHARKGASSKGTRSSEAAVEILPDFAKTASPPPGLENLRKAHTRSLSCLLDSGPYPAVTIRARLRSRMAINLSDSLIPNAGISLDRLFSAPLVPGSAVKGNARHAALIELKREKTSPELASKLAHFIAVFGCCEEDFKSGALSQFGNVAATKDRRGGVNFLPATVETSMGLVVELTNVHTPSYYTGKAAGKLSELAKESPLPNPFPAVEAGAVFLFSLALNSTGQQHPSPSDLLASAERWLKESLTVHGIGAKTGAGYGWFEMVDEPPAATPAVAATSPQTSPMGDYTEKLFANLLSSALNAGSRQTFIDKDLPKLKKPQNREWLRRFVEAIEANRDKSVKKMRTKDWYVQLKQFAEQP